MQISEICRLKYVTDNRYSQLKDGLETETTPENIVQLYGQESLVLLRRYPSEWCYILQVVEQRQTGAENTEFRDYAPALLIPGHIAAANTSLEPESRGHQQYIKKVFARSKNIEGIEIVIGGLIGLLGLGGVLIGLRRADYSEVGEALAKWLLSWVGLLFFYTFGKTFATVYKQAWPSYGLILLITSWIAAWVMKDGYSSKILEKQIEYYTWGITVFFAILIPATIGFLKKRGINEQT